MAQFFYGSQCIRYRVMPPSVTAVKQAPAHPISHAPTILRPLAGNSDIELAEALVAAKRAKRRARSGDIYNRTARISYYFR